MASVAFPQKASRPAVFRVMRFVSSRNTNGPENRLDCLRFLSSGLVMKLEWCQAKCFQKAAYPVGADPADNLES